MSLKLSFGSIVNPGGFWGDRNVGFSRHSSRIFLLVFSLSVPIESGQCWWSKGYLRIGFRVTPFFMITGIVFKSTLKLQNF